MRVSWIELMSDELPGYVVDDYVLVMQEESAAKRREMGRKR